MKMTLLSSAILFIAFVLNGQLEEPRTIDQDPIKEQVYLDTKVIGYEILSSFMDYEDLDAFFTKEANFESIVIPEVKFGEVYLSSDTCQIDFKKKWYNSKWSYKYSVDEVEDNTTQLNGWTYQSFDLGEDYEVYGDTIDNRAVLMTKESGYRLYIIQGSFVHFFTGEVMLPMSQFIP